ncbi:MAG: aspartate--tRNA ligase [Mycoplasmatota bacterium]
MKKNMNNDFNINNLEQKVTLYGWVAKKRDLGGLIFVDLRDRSGIIQLIIKPDNSFYELASNLKSEDVIKVIGVIYKRENANKNIKTGEIEVIVDELEVINKAINLPFEINDDKYALEDTRLKYRYLDMRKNSIKDRLIKRSKITSIIRNYFVDNDFIEVETPILCKSTPEGARDYLVPSRINNGCFYALPQSPQQYKQLLMIGGIEKYFQIAKCFRDEDLRADRQPEFSQVDIEMSFIEEKDIMDIIEDLIIKLFKEVKNLDFSKNFLKMPYEDAINYYGSDKPDMRFDMIINDITNIFANTEIKFFKDNILNNGVINCLVVKNKSDMSRKELDKLTEFVKQHKASNLAYLKIDDVITGSIAKLLSEEEIKNLKEQLSLEQNDLVLIISDKKNIVKNALGSLRVKLGKELNLYSEEDYKIHWVVDFPLFEYDEEEKRYYAMHHPFTAPSSIEDLKNDKGNCKARAYDLVINGYEVGGGSIRIHNSDVQQIMFEALGLKEEGIKEKFGFFVDAFKYGAPNHGGLALGLDRLVMLLTNTENIKDVIAFPKTSSASDLMCECPSSVDSKQLKELGIMIDEK